MPLPPEVAELATQQAAALKAQFLPLLKSKLLPIAKAVGAGAAGIGGAGVAGIAPIYIQRAVERNSPGSALVKAKQLLRAELQSHGGQASMLTPADIVKGLSYRELKDVAAHRGLRARAGLKVYDNPRMQRRLKNTEFLISHAGSAAGLGTTGYVGAMLALSGIGAPWALPLTLTTGGAMTLAHLGTELGRRRFEKQLAPEAIKELTKRRVRRGLAAGTVGGGALGAAAAAAKKKRGDNGGEQQKTGALHNLLTAVQFGLI